MSLWAIPTGYISKYCERAQCHCWVDGSTQWSESRGSTFFWCLRLGNMGMCTACAAYLWVYDLWFIYALWSNNVAVAMSLATLDPCFTSISIRFVWSAVNQKWLGLNMQIHIFSSIWSANVGLQTSILDSLLGHVGTHPSSVSLWTVESGLPSTLHFCPHAADFVGVKHYFQVNDQDLRSIYSHNCNYTTFIGCLVGKKLHRSSSSFFQFQDQVYFSSAMILPLSVGLPLWSLT